MLNFRPWYRKVVLLGFALLATGSFYRSRPAEQDASRQAQSLLQSISVQNRTINTKSYLDQAWETKIRAGFTANSGFAWDPASHEWRIATKLPEDAQRAIAHYASWTAVPARVALNTAQAYHELDRLDELAKFYSLFLQTYFTTLKNMRAAPDAKQKLLGPETGPDSARTMVWYVKQPDGSFLLRECYLCNADYFFPTARLVRAIAGLKGSERTPAMKQFVAAYVPLLAREHALRLNFAQRMQEDMTPGNPAYKKRIMIADEILAVAVAAELLGAHAQDPAFVLLSPDDIAQLKNLLAVGVARFQFSRTTYKDAAGRTCASYFNGDYDTSEDMNYARYEGESFPSPSQKAPSQGASWDISHFNLIPMFLWCLHENKNASGIDFPQQADIDAFANQFVFHVFEGDYQKPLFRNFFDGTDGWYRVSYSGRANYGIAPSRFCSMFDTSHGCTTISGIYSWGLLASLNDGIARVQLSLIDLAKSSDPTIACFDKQCFRERYYRYADASFSFLDSQGQLQYSPALAVVLSELAWSFSARAN
ncbi:MAG TPA: hypothetical protein VMU53_12110 [Candidatus Sulfotelmatobacter sp.]|nr:hypothetical protein [Candidatus Sulfotelmatobacter sp.]